MLASKDANFSHYYRTLLNLVQQYTNINRFNRDCKHVTSWSLDCMIIIVVMRGTRALLPEHTVQFCCYLQQNNAYPNV